MTFVTVDRWTVRECPEGHGILNVDYRCCGTCFRDLSEPFEVVRAKGARSTDPDTSKLAALRQAPRSGTQRAKILDYVYDFSPCSAREIGEATGINGAWKRVSELVQGGHLVEAGTQTDPVTGTEVTYYDVVRSL